MYIFWFSVGGRNIVWAKTSSPSLKSCVPPWKWKMSCPHPTRWSQHKPWLMVPSRVGRLTSKNVLTSGESLHHGVMQSSSSLLQFFSTYDTPQKYQIMVPTLLQIFFLVGVKSFFVSLSWGTGKMLNLLLEGTQFLFTFICLLIN